MATLPLRTLFGTLLALCCMHAGYSLSPEEREAARSVMERTVPALKAVPGKLKLEAVKQENGCDVFETESSGGVLTVRGSSGTALCRGFYDFLKTNGLGMVAWDNKDIRWPARIPDTPRRRVASPFRHHYYFNAVTYGCLQSLPEQ